MRSFSILLVVLLATVGLCKGAALEKGDKPLSELEKPVPAVSCQLTPSLCAEKNPEVESEKAEKPADTPPVGCTETASECERKKREVKPETPAAIPPVGCTGTASECERKKREVKPVEFSPPLSNQACRSLCGEWRG